MPTELKPYLTPHLKREIERLPPKGRAEAMVEVARREWALCAEDVLYWIDPAAHLVPYVYTKDPKNLYQCLLCGDHNTYVLEQRKPHMLELHKQALSKEQEFKQVFRELPKIRPFTMMPYFEPIIDVWQTEKMVAVEKSRDMMMTWLIVTLYTWDSLFHEGKQNIFQSEDASKTRELIARSQTIFDNQPSWLKRQHPAIFSEGPNRAGLLRVPSLQSEIIGFPQGVSKIRMYHPSGVFSDEAAFNPEAGETFAAIKPAIDGGGRYTAISSANLGWFERVCRDRTHEEGDTLYV
jgi:hypothetical protein